jgi:hypothetical protein
MARSGDGTRVQRYVADRTARCKAAQTRSISASGMRLKNDNASVRSATDSVMEKALAPRHDAYAAGEDRRKVAACGKRNNGSLGPRLSRGVHRTETTTPSSASVMSASEGGMSIDVRRDAC